MTGEVRLEIFENPAFGVQLLVSA